MSPTPRSPYPASAVAWLVPGGRQRLLDLGSGRGALARSLHALGHRVTCVDADPGRAAWLAGRFRLSAVAAQAENLPLRNHRMDVVTSSATLHHFAPGLALAEIARVLRPGGTLSVVYNTRDDTVPWVRRLTRLVQAADPEAMSGEFGQSSVRTLERSPYFAEPERRTFRNWVPITRDGLLSMVAGRPQIAALPAERRQALLDEVAALYASVARAPEPLLLPFEASCWRARVDHSQLDLPADEDGLSIPL